MHIALKQVLTIFFTLIGSGTLLSQSFVFKNYTTEDGLPSSETYSFAQDEKGYMWVATDRGLAKFDGYGFKTYTTNDGVPDNTIFEISKDHKNRLWFKGFSSQTGYYKNDSFYNYKYNDSISKILPSELINYFTVDKDDNIWFSKFRHSKELFSKDLCFLTKINANGVIDTSYNVYDKGKKAIFIANNGKAVVTGDLYTKYTEVFLLDDRKKITEIYHEPSRDDVLCEKLDNEYFVCVVGRTLYKLKENFLEKIAKCKTEVIDIFIDKEKNIWVGYRGKGYECLLAESNYTKTIEGLNGLTISSVFQDKEGGMWLTSLEKGLFYLAPHAFTAITKLQGLTVNRTKKIINAKGNIIILGEDENILLRKRNEQSFKVITKKIVNIPNDIVSSEAGELYAFKPVNQYVPNSNNIVLPGDQRIFEGKKHMFTYGARDITKYTKQGKFVDKINLGNLSRVWSVFETYDGGILIGTLRGLYLYKNKKIIALKEGNPLFKYRINEIKQFNKNYIVVATIGGGILLFDERDIYKVKQYKQVDGLPSLMCNTVWKENDTTLWVGTNKGICLINNILDSNKSEFMTIDINDGLTSNEVNYLCKVNDDIWVATAGGISIINKFRYLKSLQQIPVYIKSVIINGKQSVSKLKDKINYKNNNVVISYLGINYQYANQLEYKYRLKNTESEWNYTTNRSVVYSSLPAGKYVFEVGVVMPKGGNNQVYAYYTFTILPPFWQSIWFVILVIVVGVLAITFFVWARISFVREQERLKHDLKVFSDRALRGQMNPHFIYNSLNAIQNYILNHKTQASATFLSKFSRLMRLTFTNTAEEFVPLEKEIEALIIYAELENLRFNQKFKLRINIEENIDKNKTKVPPLIIQPFVENAILHGLVSKEENGNIWIDIKRKQNRLEITIKDDGIGILNARRIAERKSRFIPSGSQKNKQHSGVKTTKARIYQLWGKDYEEEFFKIINLKQENTSQTGTLVIFYLPIYD